MEKEPKRSVVLKTLTFWPEVLESLDRECAELKMSRGAFFKMLIEHWEKAGDQARVQILRNYADNGKGWRRCS